MIRISHESLTSTCSFVHCGCMLIRLGVGKEWCPSCGCRRLLKVVSRRICWNIFIVHWLFYSLQNSWSFRINLEKQFVTALRDFLFWVLRSVLGSDFNFCWYTREFPGNNLCFKSHIQPIQHLRCRVSTGFPTSIYRLGSLVEAHFASGNDTLCSIRLPRLKSSAHPQCCCMLQ